MHCIGYINITQSAEQLINAYTFSISSFERHIAKVVIEIAKPTVVEIVQDIRIRFPDMLGIIGI